MTRINCHSKDCRFYTLKNGCISKHITLAQIGDGPEHYCRSYRPLYSCRGCENLNAESESTSVCYGGRMICRHKVVRDE